MDYVTVSFLNDISILKLQAVSLEKYLQEDEDTRFICINNHFEKASRENFKRRFEAQVLPAYGRLADRVVLLQAEDLLPNLRNLGGWKMQQALKFAVAEAGHIKSESYVTLDSKNQLIRPFKRADFYTDDGRIIISPRRVDDVLRPSYEYFFPKDEIPEWGAVIWTPFILSRKHVSDMMAGITAREGVNGVEFFARRDGMLEYATYFAYISKLGLAGQLYATDRPMHGAGFWFGGQRREVIDFTFDAIRTRRTVKWLFVRRQVLDEDAAMKTRVAELWLEFGLCSSVDEGLAYIEGFRAP